MCRFAARGCGMLLGLAAAFTMAAACAQSSSYPAKPIRMVIMLAPGGGVDTTARFIAQKLSQLWGQPVVADNRPGASGTIAIENVVRAAPDGHTILVSSSSPAIIPSTMKLSYDPLNDLLPVTMAVVSPGVLVVHPAVPARNVKQLIAFARSRPGELFYSSAGQGGAQHLAIELFCQMAGLKMTHVPYKGTAPSITDLVGGRVALTVASVISTRPMFTTGRLRALAVVGTRRTPALPDYPTVAESGVPGFGADNWYGLFLPGRTDKGIAIKLQETVARILVEPATRKNILAQGLDVVASSQEEFARAYGAELATWAKVSRTLGLYPN